MDALQAQGIGKLFGPGHANVRPDRLHPRVVRRARAAGSVTTRLRELSAEVRELEARLREGGGADKIARQHEQGKLTARERIAASVRRRHALSRDRAARRLRPVRRPGARRRRRHRRRHGARAARWSSSPTMRPSRPDRGGRRRSRRCCARRRSRCAAASRSSISSIRRA